MDSIAIVIPTCDEARKPFLNYLESRIAQQTIRVNHYVKVDYPNEGGIDLSARYKQGIKKAIELGATFILLFEDDDYYPLNYVENMYKAWVKSGKPDIIGHKETIDYNIMISRYRKIVRSNFCSCRCTAVSNKVKYDICPDNVVTYDGELWKANKGAMVIVEPAPIGIKHNIGMTGKRKQSVCTIPDVNNTYLKQIVDKESFEFYTSIKHGR
jgi:hypothetical protein